MTTTTAHADSRPRQDVAAEEKSSKALANVVRVIFGQPTSESSASASAPNKLRDSSVTNGQSAAAIEAASQFMSQGINHKGAVQAGSLLNEDPPSQDANAHMLNLLLVNRLIVPLTDLRSKRYDLLETGVGQNLISVAQVLETLETTIRASPKFLEHLFITPEADQAPGNGPVRFRNTTFDVWLAPRLLSAAAAVASLYISGSPPGLPGPGAQHPLLHRTILRALASVLKASIDSVNQLDNVRLILIEALRASLQALGTIGSPSFMPDVVLPPALLNRCFRGYPATREVQIQGSVASEVRFFDAEIQPPTYRLSSRHDRPKPTDLLVADMTSQHDVSSTFSFALIDDKESNLSKYSTANALVLAAVELCFVVTGMFPAETQGLAEVAAMLLVSVWEFDVVTARAGIRLHQLPWLLQTWKLDLIATHLPMLSHSSPMPAQKLAALLAKMLVLSVETGVGGAREDVLHSSEASSDHELAALQLLAQAIKALQAAEASVRTFFASQLRTQTTMLVREIVGPVTDAAVNSKGDDVCEAARKDLIFEALLFVITNGDQVTAGQKRRLRRYANDVLARASSGSNGDDDHERSVQHKVGTISIPQARSLLATLTDRAEPIDLHSRKRKREHSVSANPTTAATPAPDKATVTESTLDAGTVTSEDAIKAFQPYGEAFLDLDFRALEDAGHLLARCRYESALACAIAGGLRQVDGESKGTGRLAAWRCSRCDDDQGADSASTTMVRARLTVWVDFTDRLLRSKPSYSAACLDALRRLVLHSPREEFRRVTEAKILSIVRLGLASGQRSGRLGGGALAAAFALRQAEGPLPTTEEGVERRRRLSALAKVPQTFLESPAPKLRETAIICIAALAAVPDEHLQGICLLSLVLELSCPNPLLKALAHTQIVQLASRKRCTTFQLLRPHLEIISTTIVERFSSMPDLWTGILNLVKMTQQGFFNATIEYTLPHLIGIICRGQREEGRKMIELIARALGTNVAKMCLTNITSIFKYFFLRMCDVRSQAFQVLLDLIAIDAANMKSLLRSRQHDVVGYLVIKLGNVEVRSSAFEGLQYIENTINDSAAAERQRSQWSQGPNEAVARFLKNEILAILAWVNQELMGEHGKRTFVERAQTARSIGALVEIIGPSISVVTPQIMATLNSTLQIAELCQSVLESWRIFITTLKFDDIGPFIGQTAAALLSAWPHFDGGAKELATKILHYLVIDNAEHLTAYIKDIPSLDTLDPEMPAISRKLRGLRESWNPDNRFKNILERVAHENSAICLQSLHELRAFLSDEQEYVQNLASGDAFSPLIGESIRMLFAAAAKSDSLQDEIRSLCFDCLGAIGAVDPDRFESSFDDPMPTLLHNFEDQDESTDFVIQLIRDLLVPAFRATDDTAHQSALAYAIQELLKFCGFGPSILSSSSGTNPIPLKTRQRWMDLPQATLDTVIPLLRSKYMVQVGKLTVRPTPIYLETKSHREWLQGWANQLISAVTDGKAGSVFNVFRVAIRDQDITIASQILPHVLLHTLVSGSDQAKNDIQLEFNAVLTDQVDPKTGYDAERRLLSAQTIFGLMDHLGVWMRLKRQSISRTSRRGRAPKAEEALSCVESLTASISQELTAQASLQCKAYARSLLNFEQRIRTLKMDNGRQDGELQTYYENLHQIYAYLDEPDGMEGISTKVVSPSLEHQIREHESTGRWTSAQSCWEVELQQRPDDASLHVGLLRCLRSLGHYDTMRTHIRGALSVHPEWEPLLASFQVEGACILGDWEQLETSLSRPSADSPQHAIGRAILAMRLKDSQSFDQIISDARRYLGKPIVAAAKGSYSSMYEVVLQLHMLHELQLIRSAHLNGMEPPQDRAAALNRSLTSRLNSTLPSFRTREPVLSVRRTAFTAIELNPALRTEIGNAWIATAKIARRAGHRQTAYSAMLQATQCQAPFAFVQRVKLLALDEQTHKAIQDLNNCLQTVGAAVAPISNREGRKSGPAIMDVAGESAPLRIDRPAYAKACLLRARLLDATLRYQTSEVFERYKEAVQEQMQSEKMWYYYGHFQDTHERILPNATMQRFNVCKALLRSAQMGTKFFYRTLPRVLTIWMEIAGDPTIIRATSRSTATVSASNQENLDTFRRLNQTLSKFSRRLQPFQWLAVFPQLVARIVQKNDEAWKVLLDIIIQVVLAYPQQAMWSMVAGSHSKDTDRRKRFEVIVTLVAGKTQGSAPNLKEVMRIVSGSQKLAKELLRLCDYEVGRQVTTLSSNQQFPGLQNVVAFYDLLLPLQSSMTISLPSNNVVTAEHRPFPPNLPTIKSFEDRIEVMNSLQKPRKVIIVGSDGKQYPFLCKPKDDLRKDARLMEFDGMINKLLQSNAESRKRKLYVRTYAVLILNEEHGLIEWVPHTVGLRHILTKLYTSRGLAIYNHDLRKHMDEARLAADVRATEDIFNTKVLSQFPPVFHEWFLATFPEPSAWLKARSSYARTAAVMSMVGFVLGLGDRHGENILFDASSGDTVHVDLNCLFDKGQKFEIPERVPFRLTHNMVDAFGVTGCEGVFRKSAEVTMAILRENRESLMSVLEAMVHDPLGEWSVPEERGRARNSSRPDPRVAEARRALDPVAQKLDGRMYRPGEREPTPPYSTNNLVDSLIKEATSAFNLAKMYVGWSSWL